MEYVSNKEKAKEITKCVWFPHKCTEGDIQNMLVEMAQWKDEQIAFALSFLKPRLSANEERSMISPDYARNFICDFILGKTQNQKGMQLSLF